MNDKSKKQDGPQPAGDSSGRCPSGVEGLDNILNGGLPSNCFYLFQGDPGSGKTTLALQFLLEGMRRGENALYITLSETKEELLKVARSHGWSLDGIPLVELSAIESLLRPEAQTTVFHPSEMELTEVSRMLREEARKAKPKRVVFDSLSEFRLIAETPLRYRRQLLALKQEFAKYQSTVLLLDDKMDSQRFGGDPHVLSLSHGVVEMEQFSPDYGSSRRRLRVMKMRGVKFREGYHDYTIETGGLRIFPRLIAAEHHAPFRREQVSSGIKELDGLFGGGLDRGTTTLIMGPAGTGKSSLALQHATQLAGKGEHCMVFTFDETLGVMLARSKALGMDLEPHIQKGLINVQQVDPAELSPGEFAVRILRAAEKGCKLVVIDSLNGYLNSMPGENYLTNQLHELCSYLNQQGVVTILVLAQHGLVAAAESPVDLSYLADTVINIRYFEAFGEVRQALAVVKKRSGQHEKTIREFKLEQGKGLRVGEPLKEFQGILSGVPTFHGKAAQMMNESDAAR
ncbi:MAG TPA: ATPase domain-containing protein [Verrucomicrobiae bacterium]|jgi:circadian clock protein KaiC|nr:ATPase domain-containing protein [Verrucomicrobiae bacterium]